MGKRPKLDILSRAAWPSCQLSNFAVHSFVFDGVECRSMEGFLQSLKFQDPEDQRTICALSGADAKKAGQSARPDWRLSQTLWWKGKPLNRAEADYQAHVAAAYDAMFAQNPSLQFTLLVTDRLKLTHSIGVRDPQQTVLTEQEFWQQLVRLRHRMTRNLLPRGLS